MATEPTSTQVMNPPADEAEARNLANSAPLQSDPADQRRGMTGVSSGSEAGPVTATQQCEHRGFYFCKKCGKDLTPDIPYADDVGSPTQYPR